MIPNAANFAFKSLSEGSVRWVPSEKTMTGIDFAPPLISITFSAADTSASTSMWLT